METQIFSHLKCSEHKTGNLHPESPARLEAVLSGLTEKEFWSLEKCEAEVIDKSKIKLVHTSEYIEYVLGSIPKMLI